MKKKLLNLFVVIIGVLTAASCSHSHEGPMDISNEKSVFMKLDLPAMTKAVEAPVAGGTVVTVNNLHLYFHDGNTILKYVNITATSTPINIAQLAAGAEIVGIPESATQVTVYGNIPTSTPLPISGTLASVKSKEIDILSQSNVANVVLIGDDKTLNIYTIGASAPVYAPTIKDGDRYVEAEIAPAVARIEIEGLQVRAASAVANFTLDGIYLNNFFEKFTLAPASIGTKVTYGAVANNYVLGQGLYTVSNSGILFDEPSSEASGTPVGVHAGGTNRWAYQVVPNNGTVMNDQLQIVFKLSSLSANPISGVTFPVGEQFVTVRGFKDNSGNLVKLEAGKIYTVSKADFEFDQSDLTTTPITTAVGLWLKVSVKAWTIVPVKPNL